MRAGYRPVRYAVIIYVKIAPVFPFELFERLARGMVAVGLSVKFGHDDRHLVLRTAIGS